MQCNAQAVDISTVGCLLFAILLRRGVAGGAECNGIPGLSWLKMASNAEINQVDVAVESNHDIGRLEVTKNNRWLQPMQVTQHSAELCANVEHFLDRETTLTCERDTEGHSHSMAQVLLQRLAFNEVHHEIPVPCIEKMIVYTREVWMHEAAEHERHEPVAEPCVLSFVNGAKAPPP